MVTGKHCLARLQMCSECQFPIILSWAKAVWQHVTISSHYQELHACRGGPGDDFGGGGYWVCSVGLPWAARHCGVLVCVSSAGWAAFSTDAGLHQVWGPQGKQLSRACKSPEIGCHGMWIYRVLALHICQQQPAGMPLLC